MCCINENGQAIRAFYRLSLSEEIVPAWESAHALAFAMDLAAQRPASEKILVNLSGRGDNDVEFVMENYGIRNDSFGPPELYRYDNNLHVSRQISRL